MSRFCRVFETHGGKQLLLFIKSSEEHPDRADMNMMFELDEGATVTVTIGNADWDKCERWMGKFQVDAAIEIIKNPMGYIKGLMGAISESDED